MPPLQASFIRLITYFKMGIDEILVSVKYAGFYLQGHIQGMLLMSRRGKDKRECRKARYRNRNGSIV